MKQVTVVALIQLQEDPSKSGKEFIIKNNLNNLEFDAILRFLFDDLIVTGIARKKLNKELQKTYHGNSSADSIISLIDYFKTNNTGTEKDIQYLVSSAIKLTNGNPTVGDMVMSIICKDLKLGCSSSTYNKANPSNPIYVHDVMAGKSWDEERALKLIQKGETLYFTEKVDGNRGTRNPQCTAIISRNGQVWKGTESILNELNKFVSDLYIIDGELVYNDITNTMTSQQIRSMTTSIMNDDKILDKGEAGIVFKIFDMCSYLDFNESDKGEAYTKRRSRLEEYRERLIGLNYVKIIPVEFTVSTVEELSQVMPRLKAFIESGKEGYMCISGSQVYKTGKGYQMMKLKNIISGDLRICGWNYGKEKTKWEGKFASFNVEFPYVNEKGEKGIYEVAIGTGYSDEFRNEVNEEPDSYIGKILEILLTEVSSNKEGGYSFSYGRMVEIRNDKNTIDLEHHSLVEINGAYYFKEDKKGE